MSDPVEDAWNDPDWRAAAEEALRNKQPMPDAQGFRALNYDDFLAYSPEHKYIFIPTGSLWPVATVNGRLPWIGGVKPSSILDRDHAVEQMTWSPGEPMIIKHKLVVQGGWIERPNSTVFNLYSGPKFTRLVDPKKAQVWVDHIRYVYPDEAEHIIKWFAYRCQHPDVKIEHALVLGGTFGIGKDTLLEPVLHALGAWNVASVSPTQMLERFNGHLKSILLVINEARDLGDVNRPHFYERLKMIIASPLPLMIDEKNTHPYYIPNLVGVVYTTNHKVSGMYLAPDDRRHLVAWSARELEDFKPNHVAYFNRIWSSYADGGRDAIATYLHELDLSDFDPKAPPPKTDAYHEMVMASRQHEAMELEAVIESEAMKRPLLTILDELIEAAEPKPVAYEGQDGATYYHPADEKNNLADWLRDRRNRRMVQRWMEQVGYVAIPNPDSKQGLWRIDGKRQMVYGDSQRIGKNGLTRNDLVKAARDWAAGRGKSWH